MTDEQRQKFLDMIEEQELLGGRFRRPIRMAANGGNGCFSLLLQAEDTQDSGKVVALKFLLPFVQDPYRLRCFEREPVMLQKIPDTRMSFSLSRRNLSSFTLCSHTGLKSRSSMTLWNGLSATWRH